MSTWRVIISEEMVRFDDSFENMEGLAIEEGGLDKEFYSGYGCSEGPEFTLWTKDRVYFPVVYDGAEWVGSVPRIA